MRCQYGFRSQKISFVVPIGVGRDGLEGLFCGEEVHFQLKMNYFNLQQNLPAQRLAFLP